MLLIQDTLPFQRAKAHLSVLRVLTAFFTHQTTNHFLGAADASKLSVLREAFLHRSQAA